jgi:hypothetical protein
MPSKPPSPLEYPYRTSGHPLVARYWYPTVLIVSILASFIMVVFGKF